MITKDEASDLQVHVDRLIQVTKELQDAEFRHNQALNVYRQFIWQLQQKAKEV